MEIVSSMHAFVNYLDLNPTFKYSSLFCSWFLRTRINQQELLSSKVAVKPRLLNGDR